MHRFTGRRNLKRCPIPGAALEIAAVKSEGYNIHGGYASNTRLLVVVPDKRRRRQASRYHRNHKRRHNAYTFYRMCIRFIVHNTSHGTLRTTQHARLKHIKL